MPIFSTDNPTLADYRTAVEAKGYDVDDAVLDAAINAAYQEVLAARRWDFLYSTSAFTLTEAAPTLTLTGVADLVHADRILLQDVNGLTIPVAYHAPEERLMRMAEDDSAGTPQYWTRTGIYLRFYPNPDATYYGTVYYLADAPALENPTDVGAVPRRFMDSVVWGATANLAYRQRDYASADRAEAKRNDAVNRMVREYGIAQRQGNRRVVDTGFWDDMA